MQAAGSRADYALVSFSSYHLPPRFTPSSSFSCFPFWCCLFFLYPSGLLTNKLAPSFPPLRIVQYIFLIIHYHHSYHFQVSLFYLCLHPRRSTSQQGRRKGDPATDAALHRYMQPQWENKSWLQSQSSDSVYLWDVTLVITVRAYGKAFGIFVSLSTNSLASLIRRAALPAHSRGNTDPTRDWKITSIPCCVQTHRKNISIHDSSHNLFQTIWFGPTRQIGRKLTLICAFPSEGLKRRSYQGGTHRPAHKPLVIPSDGYATF